ncbi:MAG: 16S rRNA (uracil(1498)-N(3))-methyltransferase [Actinomycetes bacterium]|jgi:16S rRNA (uracil1498-N3)-methyltransferase|nr:16S rRNA (uracil(1498)-N(3))-methyltransferase [Actinomycetes bacterium]
MALARFFVEAVSADWRQGQCLDVPLSAADLRHATRALRLKPGEELELVPRGDWVVWRAELVAVSEDVLRVKLVAASALPRLAFRLALVFGLAKGRKNDCIVRQATELGVDCLMPVIFTRSITRPAAENIAARSQRLREIVRAAAKQSHRADIPQLADIATFDEYLVQSFPHTPTASFPRKRESTQSGETLGLDSRVKPENDNTLKPENDNNVPENDACGVTLVLWEETPTAPLSTHPLLHNLPAHSTVTLVIGPEGGITHEEISALRTAGAHTASLGPTILRVDTAAVAALAVVRDVLLARTAA